MGHAEEESGDVHPLRLVMGRMSRRAIDFKPLEMEPSTACHMDLPGQQKVRNVGDKPQV